jgi:hypothetical protein
VDLVSLLCSGEAHPDQQVADTIGGCAVEELDCGEVCLAEVLSNPDGEAMLLLGQVGDDLAEVAMIGDLELVLDDELAGPSPRIRLHRIRVDSTCCADEQGGSFSPRLVGQFVTMDSVARRWDDT